MAPAIRRQLLTRDCEGLTDIVKPRILQLIDSFEEGGSERQAIDLTRRLNESGKFEIHLATLKAEGVLRAQVEQLELGPIPSFPLRSCVRSFSLVF